MIVTAEEGAPESESGAGAIVEAVRTAGEGAADPKAATLARQARAAQLDLVGPMSEIPAGSPEGQRLRAELRALGITGKALEASLSWYRRQKAGGKGWEERLLRDKDGDLESIAANAITILRNDPAWEGVLAWDDFAQAIVFRQPAPWYDDDRPAEETGVLDDYNSPSVGAWLARRYRLKLSDEGVYKAARTVAMGPGRRFDSLRDWVRGLRWDGVRRIGAHGAGTSWLTTYLGVADSNYARFVGRAWMVSAVARAMVPGCQVDHVLILEGAQEIGKSSAFRILVGERFSDSPLPLHDKDRFINLRAVHVQSFDELAGLGKADQNAVKNFLTARTDIFRPPYGRDPVKLPRRNVFGGTVNPRSVGYLKDDTGARRFWPVLCGAAHPMDLVALARDREQIWAEAVAMYEGGVLWHPANAEERTWCRGEQEERQERDVWEERVRAYLDSSGRFARDDGSQEEYVARPRAPLQHASVDVILADGLGVLARDQGQAHQNRVASIMAGLGWTHERRMIDGTRAWRYHRPAPATLEGRMLRATEEAARLRAEAERAEDSAAHMAVQLEVARVAAQDEVGPAPAVARPLPVTAVPPAAEDPEEVYARVVAEERAQGDGWQDEATEP